MAFHYFDLAEATDKWYLYGYSNLQGNSYTHIGEEYDFIAKYNFNASIDVLLITSYLNSGNFITENNIATNNASKLFFQVIYHF